MAQFRDIVKQVPSHLVLPPATTEQLEKLRGRLGCELPRELTDALAVTTGLKLDCPVSFLGEVGGQDLSPLCPHMLQLCEDGFGNSWGLDCDTPPGEGCRVLFACHDPPALMFSAATIEEFLQFAIAMQRGEAPEFHEDGLGTLSGGAGTLVIGGQPRRLSKRERAVIDLTHATPGDGFWWAGRGSEFAARRVGSGPVFEVWRE